MDERRREIRLLSKIFFRILMPLTPPRLDALGTFANLKNARRGWGIKGG